MTINKWKINSTYKHVLNYQVILYYKLTSLTNKFISKLKEYLTYFVNDIILRNKKNFIFIIIIINIYFDRQIFNKIYSNI